MINVADIANQATPQPAAAPPAQTGDGDDFFDHLLREVERLDVDRQETVDRESATDETADKPADDKDEVAAAEATPVAPAPAAVPWPLVAAAAEVTALEMPAVAAADPTPVAAAPAPVAQPGDESSLQPQAPAAPTNTAAAPPAGAAAPSAAPTPTPLAPPTGTAASNTPAPPNAAAAATAPVATPDANAAQAEAANVPDTGLTAPVADAAEAESILQVMGPRLTQAATTTPAPAPAMPAVAIEAAPLRTLREAAPASPAGATSDGATPVAAAASATANAGTGKGNSGDLGFKTDLGSVFAALNASDGGVTPDDFQSLVATQARNAAEAPVAGDVKAPTPAGSAGTAPASAGAAIAAAQAPLNANQAEASQAAAARPSAHHAAANPATMQISVQMIRAIGDGVSKISVDLNPVELGRVEVKIEVGRDGRVQGTVTADRQDTFDMLQRDSRALERALQDAGLKADPQSLSFNLRGESQQGRTAPENPAARADMREAAVAEELPPPPPPSRPSNMPTGAIDIRV